MSGRAIVGWTGVGHRLRLIFWLTVFQNYILPLFFIGLLSYLVGIKKEDQYVFPMQERQLSLSSLFKKDLSIMPLCVFLVMFCAKSVPKCSETASFGRLW